MSFCENRLEQMRAECEEFHRKNPEIWQAFVRLTFDRIGKGFRHYSTQAIFEAIRWEMDVATGDGLSSFKLNNNFCAFYGRRFMRAFPEYAGFFRTRRQKSELDPPSNLPPLGPEHYETFPNGSGSIAR